MLCGVLCYRLLNPVRFDICRIKLIAGNYKGDRDMKTFRDNIELKNQMYAEHSKQKKLKEYISSYNREVMLSEYVSIPKSRLRRLIITEVLAWGIATFILIVSLLH